MKVLKWPFYNILVVVIVSDGMNEYAVCLHVCHSDHPLLPPPLLDWTVCSLPGSKALKLHHCDGPAFMQLACPLKRTCRYSLRCVCVCVYTFKGYCLTLEIHSDSRDGHTVILKALCIVSFVRLTHLLRVYLGPLEMTLFLRSSNKLCVVVYKLKVMYFCFDSFFFLF